MYKTLSMLIVCALMIGMFGGAVQGQEMEGDPLFTVEELYDEVFAGNIDAALDYLTDDAVLTIVPAPGGQADAAFIGKEEIGEWFEGLHADNGRAEYSDVEIVGARCTWTAKWYSDWFESIDMSPAEFEGVAIIQDGKVRSMIWAWTQEYEARMNAREEQLANKDLARRYLDAWEVADQETLDEMFGEDFVNHSAPLPPDREGMMEFAADHRSSVPDGDYTIHELVAEGDKVFIFGHFQGTDEEPSFFWSALIRIEDGKIAERWGS